MSIAKQPTEGPGPQWPGPPPPAVMCTGVPLPCGAYRIAVRDYFCFTLMLVRIGDPSWPNWAVLTLLDVPPLTL
jgi:hypothetical protein